MGTVLIFHKQNKMKYKNRPHVSVALNNLPPKYFVTEKGQLFSQLDILKQQFEIDVISAIANAAVHVRSNPRHTAPL